MSLFRSPRSFGSLKDKQKAYLQVEQLDERLVPTVTASMNHGVLVVRGDAAANRIMIESVGSTGAVKVLANGSYVNVSVAGVGTRQIVSPDNIEVHGAAGNDTLWTDSLGSFQGYISLNGGTGNDLVSLAYAASYDEGLLIGGAGNDILIGGRFTDRLNGNAGRDVLIGGQGADYLYAGAGQDLVIAGFTRWDAMPTNEYAANHPLRAVSSWWQRTDRTYTQRVQGLLYNRHGYMGPRVDDMSVRTDFDRDEMFGDADLDYFYTDPGQDDVRDTGGSGETLAWIWRT